MKVKIYITLLMIVLFFLGCSQSDIQNKEETLEKTYEGKKILYVDSYHEGYEWSDGITNGIQETLDGTGVDLKIYRMDTKRNPDEGFKEKAGLEAKSVIEEFEPDVVITSDDNAFK
jgi:hypothetical protein